MSSGSWPDVAAFADFIEGCQQQLLARLGGLDPARHIQRAPYSYAKIEIARDLRLPVFMSRRPLSACGERCFEDCSELVRAVVERQSPKRSAFR